MSSLQREAGNARFNALPLLYPRLSCAHSARWFFPRSTPHIQRSPRACKLQRFNVPSLSGWTGLGVPLFTVVPLPPPGERGNATRLFSRINGGTDIKIFAADTCVIYLMKPAAATSWKGWHEEGENGDAVAWHRGSPGT